MKNVNFLDNFEYNKITLENKDIWIDLGCGKGELSVKLASRYPEKKLISIDISQKVVERTQKKIDFLKLDNIYAMQGNYIKLFEKIPDNSIEKIFLVCPDPWFKNKHKKRRTLTIDFQNTIFSKLKKNGTFIFATDHCPYMLKVISEEQKFWKNPFPSHSYIHKIKNFPYSTYMEKSLASDGRIFFFIRKKS